MNQKIPLALIVSFLTVSCTSQPKADVKGQGALSAKNGGDSDMPVPPKDAQYTIYCQAIAGPDHFVRSRALRQLLVKGTPMKDWYVIHATDQSTLYYGFYRNIDPRDAVDAAEGKRAMADLHMIRTMVDTSGQPPFSASLPVLINSPDPAANPAWDLTRSGAYWSLEIAVYSDSPDRKQAAVDAVRAARAQGIEAYYYHGERSSSVCIGAWPQQAVREIDAKAQNDNPDMPIYVTSEPLSPQAAKSIEAQGMKPIAPQVQIIDPTLTETMRRFPEHAVNGYVTPHKVRDPATGQESFQPESSYLVKGPFQSPDNDGSSPMAEGGAPAAAMRAAPPDSQPGMGKLKSLGD